MIVVYFLDQLRSFLAKRQIGGQVAIAPLPVKLFPGTIREPDILYVSTEHIPTDPHGYPEFVDLVIEIVSAGAEAHRRDYHDKRADYAKASVAEYWIVDPEAETISILNSIKSALCRIVVSSWSVCTQQIL